MTTDPDRSGARPVTVRVEAVVDLDAVTANTRLLLDRVRTVDPAAGLMAVVKADGYGHGAVPCARAALRAGAGHLGVATPDEALALRAAGITAPIAAWLWPAGQDIAAALVQTVELGVSSLAHLDAVLAAAAGPGMRPRIHLKIDTGLGRNGVGPAELSAVADALAAAVRADRVTVAGTMSHLACADEPGDESVADQTRAFRAAVDLLRDRGIDPGLLHLANTPAVLDRPETVFDLGRCGIGLYGLDPLGGARGATGLRPAMTLRSTVALVKRVPAGFGVSYGLTWRPDRATTLALVPLGYADGFPRSAGNSAELSVVDRGGRGRRYPVVGRVAMDQVVLDCGDDDVTPGDEVLVFGPGDRGEPTAAELAQACGTIDYEIVTRIGPRVPRRHRGRDAVASGDGKD